MLYEPVLFINVIFLESTFFSLLKNFLSFLFRYSIFLRTLAVFGRTTTTYVIELLFLAFNQGCGSAFIFFVDPDPQPCLQYVCFLLNNQVVEGFFVLPNNADSQPLCIQEARGHGPGEVCDPDPD